MATHWRATETDGLPEFDATEERSGGGDLVLAPLPGLPTRWDALDQPDPAFAPEPPPGNELALRSAAPEGDAFTDGAFSTDAFSTDAFTDGAFSTDAFTDAFTDGAFPNDAFTTPGIVAPAPPVLASLIDDLQRVCLRLVGIRGLANSIAREAINTSVTAQHPGGDPLIAMVNAVRACIEAPLPDEQRIPFYQHRARLRRDLARRGDQDRAILAMRHLVGVPPSGVAARLNVPESQVRETASQWWPDDSRVDSLALLRGIDSWISTDLGSAAAGMTGNELAHLDQVE